MDRRHFLQFSGSSFAGYLTGCGGGSSSDDATTPAPNDINWSQLASTVSGQVLLPGQPDYSLFAPVINSRYQSLLPKALVRCRSNDDVRATIAFAKQNGLPLVPRGGGHGFIGNSASLGIVLDIGLINTITVNNDNTATIGAGATLVDVCDQLIANGVGLASGTCPTVGIAGLTLGGGIGVLDRLYGLTCDSLLAAEIITADGVLHQCSTTQNADLFWALRGGGGGHFGVVTSFQFTTHAVRDFTVARATFRFDEAADVIDAWQHWPATIDNTVWAQIFIDFGGNVTLTAYALADVVDVQAHWQSLLTAIGHTPLQQDIALRSYRDVMLAMCGNLTASQCHRVGQTADARDHSHYPFVASSDFFVNTFPATAIQAFLQGIQTQRNRGASGYVILDLMGGAIADIAKDATAFCHRDALFSVEYWEYTTGSSRWPNDMRTTMAQWSSGGAYVNYPDPYLQNWQQAYYGENHARLRSLKTQFDSENFFAAPHGI